MSNPSTVLKPTGDSCIDNPMAGELSNEQTVN